MSGSEQESYAQNRRRAAELEQRKERIRQLNDQLRTTLTGGYVTLTSGLRDLGSAAVTEILRRVVQFDAFDPDNDPYGEHDFGCVSVGEHRIYFKIDYYDKRLEFGSPDPSDPTVTARVLTILLASEY